MRKAFLSAIVMAGWLIAQPALAEPLASCPKNWRFGKTTQTLHWAEVWEDNQNAKTWEKIGIPGGNLVRWDINAVEDRPLFLICLYGASWRDHLAVSIPEGTATCEIQWAGKNSDRVTRAECTGTLRGEPSRVFQVEEQSLNTAIEGLRLRRSEGELREVVRARGGQWDQLAAGAPADITIANRKLRVIFSLTSGLSREIILYGPPLLPGKDKPFYTAMIQRFGFPIDPILKPCGSAWDPQPEIQVEWRHTCGPRTGPVEQEMRLVDMKDPQSIRDREGGRRP